LLNKRFCENNFSVNEQVAAESCASVFILHVYIMFREKRGGEEKVWKK
jgi:hypothetical protein